MKREIHRSTDVTSHLIEQALVLATATVQVSLGALSIRFCATTDKA